MSIIRILFGVIIGGCIAAGFLMAAVRFPGVAMFGMCGTGGGLVLWAAYDGLRTGVVRARRSRYERNSSPWGFWFYIFFYTFIGAVVVGFGVYYLLLPMLHRQ